MHRASIFDFVYKISFKHTDETKRMTVIELSLLPQGDFKMRMNYLHSRLCWIVLRTKYGLSQQSNAGLKVEIGGEYTVLKSPVKIYEFPADQVIPSQTICIRALETVGPITGQSPAYRVTINQELAKTIFYNALQVLSGAHGGNWKLSLLGIYFLPRENSQAVDLILVLRNMNGSDNDASYISLLSQALVTCGFGSSP